MHAHIQLQVNPLLARDGVRLVAIGIGTPGVPALRACVCVGVFLCVCVCARARTRMRVCVSVKVFSLSAFSRARALALSLSRALCLALSRALSLFRPQREPRNFARSQASRQTSS